jgi:hypothetical protein
MFEILLFLGWGWMGGGCFTYAMSYRMAAKNLHFTEKPIKNSHLAICLCNFFALIYT